MCTFPWLGARFLVILFLMQFVLSSQSDIFIGCGQNGGKGVCCGLSIASVSDLSKGFHTYKRSEHHNLIFVHYLELLQCPKLSFYFVHSQGALLLKLCTRKLLHAPSQYIAIINSSKNMHTLGAHLRKPCTRPWKCAHRVQGAPLISDTVL